MDIYKDNYITKNKDNPSIGIADRKIDNPDIAKVNVAEDLRICIPNANRDKVDNPDLGIAEVDIDGADNLRISVADANKYRGVNN